MPKSIQTLRTAILNGDKVVFLEVLPRVTTLTLRDPKGNTLLHLAVSAPQHALFMTHQLLEGGQLSIHSRNEVQETPLHYALVLGDLAVVRLLLSYGANPHAKNAKGETPLQQAFLKNQVAILHAFSKFNVVDAAGEQLQLIKNIESLLEPPSLVIDTLNALPLWYTYLPLGCHAQLKALQENLMDRRFLFPLPETEKDLKQSAKPEKEKKHFLKSPGRIGKLKDAKETPKMHPQLEQLIELLQSLKSTAEEGLQVRAELKNVVQTCNHLLQYYTSSLTDREVGVVSPTSLRVYTENMGYRELLPSSAKRFICYFEPEGSDARKKNYKENAFGMHDVVQMNHTHYKISPTAPGIEYAVHALSQLFTGQGLAATELFMVTQAGALETRRSTKKTAIAVLASKTVTGQSFRDLVEKHPQDVSLIDPYNYSLQYILALLTQTVDGKADNYIAKVQYDHRGQFLHYELVGIDNDEAFSEPIFATRSGNHALMLKSILFCLPQRKHSIDLVLRKQLLEQDPARIVIRWLKLLQRYNQPYETAFEQGAHRETLKSIGLPLRLVPQMAIGLYQRLCMIQSKLKVDPLLTHEALLRDCYPLVGRYYDYVCDESKGDFILAGELLYGGKFFEELTLTDAEKNALSGMTQWSNHYVKQRTQSILLAAQEWIEALDFSVLAPSLQQRILTQFVSDFPEISRLTLKGCTVLGASQLGDMAFIFRQLERLTLVNCGRINVQGIKALLTRFPKLSLTLQGYEALEAHELLAIAEYCTHFYLVLPNGSMHWVSPKNAALLPEALQQNDILLLTFLLLAGFHLAQADRRYSPLQEAITQKNVHLVQELIRYRSDVNQLVKKVSPLDKAYTLLKALPSQTDPTCTALLEIMGMLLEAGAIECSNPKPVLDLGLTLYRSPRFAHLAERLMTFALCHNQLTPLLVSLLVSNQTTLLDWSRQTHVGYQLTDAVLQALFVQAPNLQTLNLSGCKGVETAHLQRCVTLGVKKIILDFDQVLATKVLTDTVLDLAFRKAGVQLVINAIQLNGNKMVQAHFDLMLRALTHPNNAVKQLEITNSFLTEEQVRNLAKALLGFASLQHFILRGTGIGKKQVGLVPEFYNLITALKKHPLEELVLESNEIDASRIDALRQLLENHPSLKVFSLFGNPIGDEGIRRLAKPLRLHRCLEKLNLNQVGLSDSDLVDWVAVGIPPSLIFLDVGYNQLTQASVPTILELVNLNQAIEVLRCEGEESFMAALEKTQLSVMLLENQQKSRRRQLLRRHQHAFLEEQTTSLVLPKPSKTLSSPRGVIPKKPPSLRDKKEILGGLREVGGQSWILLLEQHWRDAKELPEMQECRYARYVFRPS